MLCCTVLYSVLCCAVLRCAVGAVLCVLCCLPCAHEERRHGLRGRTEKAERERPFSTGSNTADGLFQRILVELKGFLTDFSRANGWR